MDFIIPFIAGIVASVVVFLVYQRDTGTRTTPRQGTGGGSDEEHDTNINTK